MTPLYMFLVLGEIFVGTEREQENSTLVLDNTDIEPRVSLLWGEGKFKKKKQNNKTASYFPYSGLFDWFSRLQTISNFHFYIHQKQQFWYWLVDNILHTSKARHTGEEKWSLFKQRRENQLMKRWPGQSKTHGDAGEMRRGAVTQTLVRPGTEDRGFSQRRALISNIKAAPRQE